MSKITRDIKSYDTNEQKHFLMELRKLGIDIPTYSVYEIKETPETFEISINEETPTIELKKELIEIIKKSRSCSKEASELDKEREESKNINDFIRDLEGLIVFIETFFERLEQEKMGIEEPLGILKHLLSMLNRKKEKWEKEVSEIDVSKKQIEADKLEEYYENLKPIEEMISNWSEGGEYLSCPECKFVLDKEAYIEDSTIHGVVVCGKCGSEWEVFGKLVGYRKYQK